MTMAHTVQVKLRSCLSTRQPHASVRQHAMPRRATNRHQHLAQSLSSGTGVVQGRQGVSRHSVCAWSASTIYEGSLMAPGIKFAVIVGQFNSLVTDRLESGALAGLRKSGVDDRDVDIVHVPGSFEIPVVAKAMALTGKYGAVICIGAVVRGATTHYEEVCSAATSGCSHAAVASGVPVIFGVITTETMEQALDRAGGKVGNKGFEAAVTAVEMATLMSKLRSDNSAAELDAFQ
eukprot:jgi/Ulvmu1/1584/UM111_0012.1